MRSHKDKQMAFMVNPLCFSSSTNPTLLTGRSGVQHGQVLVRTDLVGCRMLLLYLILLTWEKAQLALWGLFYKGINPIYKGSAFITSQKLHLLVPSHWALSFNIRILRRPKYSVYNTYIVKR